MKTISFMKGTMMFNRRVLSLGSVVHGRSYTLEELKNKIFFNKVFWGNMNEIFQKYRYYDIIDDYTDALIEYTNNITDIFHCIKLEYPGIVIGGSDTFERRLATEINMENQLIAEYFPNIESVQTRFKSSSDIIYFLSILRNGYIGISYVDPRKSMYQHILHGEVNGAPVYWKSDDCILGYVKSIYGNDTIITKITTSLNTDIVSKVEYWGDEYVMEELRPIFHPDTLILQNPYIYIDDIQRILESRIIYETVPTPKYKSLTWDDIFDKDIIVEYPILSFDVYLQLLRLAAVDNNVQSIHLTLYRIGNDPVLYDILRDAISNGIDVYVNIELRATGESINKFWTTELKKIGVNVTHFAHGFFKIHSKVTLITFQDGRMVAQIGTGNYHSQTVTQYTDLSLITTEMETCVQIENFFKIFQGSESEDLDFDFRLLVTRYNARDCLRELIRNQGKLGKNGYIGIKCNILNDEEISSLLSEAASRGCRIDLIIRGVCNWIPWQYLNDNVMIKSIVWDKLEHSRVYCFGNVNPKVYIGSLDPAENKLDTRIETLVLIRDPRASRVVSDYLNNYIINTQNSWLMTVDDSGEIVYVREDQYVV